MFETAAWMPTDVPVATVAEVAAEAEALGFDYFVVPDEGTTRDFVVALTASALATQRIKLGPAVTNPYTRHPVTSATAMATLDELSGGRAFMGYGIGGSLVLDPLGYKIERPLRRCREAIEITRELYKGKPVTYHGEFYTVENVSIQFPVRNDLPIYFAARGSKMLKLGGELTDGQFLSGKAKFDLEQTVEDIMAGARISGRPQKIFYAVHVAYEPAILEDIKANYTYMIVDSPEYVQQKLGLIPDQVEAIRTKMIREGIRAAAPLITEEMLQHFIVMGDDETCAREIARLMKAYPFDVFNLPVPAIANVTELLRHTARIIQRAKEIFAS